MSASVKASMGMEIAAFRASLKEAKTLLGQFKGQMQGEGSGGGKQFAGGFKSVVGGVALGSIIAEGLKKAASLALDAGRFAGGQFLEGVKTAAENETLEIAFEVLTGSKAQAKKTLDDIRELGSSTPLEFFDLASAARSLIAFGEDANVVPETLRRVGDVASGVGAPIGEIAELYGKARVQGTLFAEDLNQLMGRGININQQFANQLGVAPGEIKKLASEGQITFPMLERAFRDLTGEGGAFYDMLGRQSKTLPGLISTMKDSVTELRLEFGKPVAIAMKPLVAELTEGIKGMKEESRDFGEWIAQGVDILVAGIQVWKEFDLGSMITENLAAGFKMAANFLSDLLIGVVGGTGLAFSRTLAEAGRLFGVLIGEVATPSFWEGMRSAFVSIAASFEAGLIDAVATLLETLREVPLIGEKLGIGLAPEFLRASAAGLRRDSTGAGVDAAVRMGGAISRVNAEFLKSMKGIVADFRAGRAMAPKFDNMKITSIRLEEMFAEFERKYAAVVAARKGAGGEEGGGGGDGGVAEGSAGGLSAAPAGIFGQAINAALGRSVNEVVAMNSQKALGEAQKQNEKLDGVNQKLTRVITNLAGRDDIQINVRPVWSNG